MEKRFLIQRWLRNATAPLPIYDESSVSSARQRVREIGRERNLSTELIENAALIVSELAHNQLLHARHGYVGIEAFERGGAPGMEIVAADVGGGIEKPALAIEDGVSTSNRTLGAGLGAVCRIADEVEFDDRLSEGLRICARKFESRPATSCCDWAIMGRPYPGEPVSGDDAVFVPSENGFLAAVLDGLGHGSEAREASNRAVDLILDRPQLDLAQLAVEIDAELEGTRGCAIGLARFLKHEHVIECAAAGDVHSHLYSLREAHFFTPTPLVLGAGQIRRQKVRVEERAVEPRSVLVMFSDGLKSRTTLKGQLDVLRRPAIAIAQHLLDNDSRGDDDAIALVVRFGSGLL